MDFRNFSIPYVFEVKESISRSFPKLLCLSDLENPSQLPVLQILKGTDDWVLLIFEISSFPTSFEVEESIFRNFAKLLCSGNPENPGQLPVL